MKIHGSCPHELLKVNFLYHCILTVSVTAAVGGRPLFFAGSPVAGVVGVLGVGIDSGAGVAGPDWIMKLMTTHLRLK